MLATHSPDAPTPLGSYSQAITAGNFIFCSGQIGVDPITQELVGEGTTEQATQALKNIDAILKKTGASSTSVIKVEIFLKNIADFSAVNEVYTAYFSTKPYPARVTIGVSNLPKNAAIEIACIAYIDSPQV